MADTIKYPFGAMDNQVLADSATPSITVLNTVTRITNPVLGQAVTGLVLVAGTGLVDGAEVFVVISQSGTGRDVAFNLSNSTAPALTGVSDDIDVIALQFQKSSGLFLAKGLWAKIHDDA